MRTLGILLLLLAGVAGCGKTTGHQNADGPAAETKSGGAAAYDFSAELTPDRARELIPRAASLSRAEYEGILEHPPVWLREIKNQSLTAILLAVNPFDAREENPGAGEGFRYLAPTEELVPPSLLEAAVEGGPDAEFVSLIQPEYITNCTCLSQGEFARGRVDYRAGKLYEGSADFTAQRHDGEWQIVAFEVPEFRLITRRQPDGSWRLIAEENLLGVPRP